jgi:hypothetical protein
MMSRPSAQSLLFLLFCQWEYKFVSVSKNLTFSKAFFVQNPGKERALSACVGYVGMHSFLIYLTTLLTAQNK